MFGFVCLKGNVFGVFYVWLCFLGVEVMLTEQKRGFIQRLDDFRIF